LLAKSWSLSGYNKLQGIGTRQPGGRPSASRQQQRALGELKLSELFGTSADPAALARWMPGSLRMALETEAQRVGRSGDGFDLGRSLLGMDRPRHAKHRVEVVLGWQQKLSLSYSRMAEKRPRPSILDGVQLTRSFQERWSSGSLRTTLSACSTGEPCRMVGFGGEIALPLHRGVSFRSQADMRLETRQDRSRERLDLKTGLDLAGLFGIMPRTFAPTFLEASSLVRMGGHANPDRPLTAVADAQWRLVGGWRF
jgi:hypothetical protein